MALSDINGNLGLEECTATFYYCRKEFRREKLQPGRDRNALPCRWRSKVQGVLRLRMCFAFAKHILHSRLQSYVDQASLEVEESGVIPIRQCAEVGAAEDTVAVAGYGVVGRVAQNFWQELKDGCGGAPEASELLEDEEDGVGAGEQIFVGEFLVDDDVDRVQVGGVGAVAGEDADGDGALQRGETENGFAIAAENELDEAVA